MKRSFLFFFAVLVCLTACSNQKTDTASKPERQDVVVSAASSLKDAFTEIGKALETRDSTIKVTFNFAASNLLARQIESGVPADLFASAGKDVVDSLAMKGLVGKPVYFATNTLVVVTRSADSVPHEDRRHTTFSKLQDLAGESGRIALASPGVPARVYAEEALRKAGMWDKMQDHFVFGENVRQVLEYVANGSAAYGFVYTSDVSAAKGRVAVALTVPDSLHRPILYPLAGIITTKNKKGSDQFIHYVLGDSGQAILKKWGFGGSLK